MEPIQLFQLATKQADWLSVRESVVAGNIANANTPGYKTRDVTPFSQVLDSNTAAQGGQLSMVSTNPKHFGVTGTSSSPDIREVNSESMNVSVSGNNVGIAQEMMKSSEIRQQYDLNTSLVKALNRMMLMAVRRT